MSTCNKLCLFLTILTISQTGSTGRCPAPSPCKCSSKSIYCNRRRITSIPSLIDPTNTTYRLFLNNNPNLVITDDSFTNISLDYLKLDNDVYISISKHALKSQRYTLKQLIFSAADLKKVPEALIDLDKLQNINIANNKIQDWNVRVMKKLGVSLTKIDISNTGLTSWPIWLSDMSNLQWLNIRYNEIEEIPHNAFSGFYLKLKYLDIRHIAITSMPTSLQTLEELSELFIGALILNDLSFNERWLPSKLKTLHIMRTKITKIPIGLHESTSLKTLEILESPIEYVGKQTLPKYLTDLTIKDGLLNHIDDGVCSLSLTRLSLSRHNIERIEKNDLRDCSNLTYLFLNYNKIHYISPFAFDRLTQLDTLWLSGNRFNHFPTAIGSLHSLGRLFFEFNSLECTCHDYWFIQWRSNHTGYLHVTGRCTHLDDFDQEVLKQINNNISCENDIYSTETPSVYTIKTSSVYSADTSGAELLNLITVIKYLPLYIVFILQSI